MANWIGTSRSNYFRIKDEAAFRKWAEDLELEVLEKESLFGVAPSRLSDDGGWPSFRYNEERDEDEDIDIVDEIAAHLADGEIAVLIQIGAEKLRYLDGYATAFNHKGEYVQLTLNDIYELAKKQFGIEPTRAEY